MNKQTIINRLEALDLSQYPYFEIKELIRDLGKGEKNNKTYLKHFSIQRINRTLAKTFKIESLS